MELIRPYIKKLFLCLTVCLASITQPTLAQENSFSSWAAPLIAGAACSYTLIKIAERIAPTIEYFKTGTTKSCLEKPKKECVRALGTISKEKQTILKTYPAIQKIIGKRLNDDTAEVVSSFLGENITSYNDHQRIAQLRHLDISRSYWQQQLIHGNKNRRERRLALCKGIANVAVGAGLLYGCYRGISDCFDKNPPFFAIGVWLSLLGIAYHKQKEQLELDIMQVIYRP